MFSGSTLAEFYENQKEFDSLIDDHLSENKNTNAALESEAYANVEDCSDLQSNEGMEDCLDRIMDGFTSEYTELNTKTEELIPLINNEVTEYSSELQALESDIFSQSDAKFEALREELWTCSGL